MNLPFDTDEELIKEVYARFGLTYYISECLYRGLCNFYVLGTFESKADITRPRIEEKLHHAFGISLGQLIPELVEIVHPDIYKDIERSVEDRNFLAHHFWFMRIHLMSSNPGLIKMIQELSALEDKFSSLNRKIETLTHQLINKYGIEDTIQEEFQKALAGKMEEWEPLKEQRRLKKKEKIIDVWDLPLQGGNNLIFQSEDGVLWQLCDVGLGWTKYEKLGSNWKTNKVIKKYLPANINPRPKTKKAWNYEFMLAKKTVLWVKKSEQEKVFKWGVRHLH